MDVFSNNEFLRHLQIQIEQFEIGIPNTNEAVFDDIRENENHDIKADSLDHREGNSDTCKGYTNDPKGKTDILSVMEVSTCTLTGEEKGEDGVETVDVGDDCCECGTDDGVGGYECGTSDKETAGVRDRLQTLTSENVGQQESEKEAGNQEITEKISLLAQSLRTGNI